jgi:hypothetical protein
LLKGPAAKVLTLKYGSLTVKINYTVSYIDTVYDIITIVINVRFPQFPHFMLDVRP